MKNVTMDACPPAVVLRSPPRIRRSLYVYPEPASSNQPVQPAPTRIQLVDLCEEEADPNVFGSCHSIIQ